ncbi:hypothetical protein HYPSUDRAFT_94895, partial [Hypholoma sublateritium FD-334 SS-4]
LEILHQHLGHLNYGTVKHLVREGLATGVNLSKQDLKSEPPICAACVEGKMKRASFPRSETDRAAGLLDLVHSDLWGPAPVTSLGGYRYIITFTDD